LVACEYACFPAPPAHFPDREPAWVVWNEDFPACNPAFAALPVALAESPAARAPLDPALRALFRTPLSASFTPFAGAASLSRPPLTSRSFLVFRLSRDNF